ncbi:MAG: pirin family protein [Bacteroidota bacterium]|nr:pirin family protein [Bacteroidota bacterium]MDX5431575.1 pirin family protein [Bacteroidota bacterium]MDX5470295.1 pirin family protein [Bacteroidota bacterium]
MDTSTQIILEERSRDIGDFTVGRILPSAQKKMIGPFVYMDHMGPVQMGGEHYMDVDQHPHIGLSTLTYLFEGEIMHEDSIGSFKKIGPGSVNWMTAGKGITHTERTPQDLRDGRSIRMHGYQFWVAMPKEKEEMNPSFYHADKSVLPVWESDGAHFQLVAGKAFGHESPVPVHSPMFLLDIHFEEVQEFDSQDGLFGEIGVCIVEGNIRLEGQEYGKGRVPLFKNRCRFAVAPQTRLLILGGDAFPERRYIDWNFVSSDREKINAAKSAWMDKSFPLMAKDNSYVPYPVKEV